MSKRKKNIVKPLAESVSALSNREPHIHSLRFPNYRSLYPNSELPFEFPITVLLGRNGTNKSSIIHALYGSTRGNSVSKFWFGTELDVILEAREGLRQSVVHRYKLNGEIVECIKVRAQRGASDPDYWETSQPRQSYGFDTDAVRQQPIDLEVAHFDFRGELPAFDKYFYFPDRRHLAQLARAAKSRGTLRRGYRQQDYIRQRSSRLKRKIEEEGSELTDQELGILQYILERSYRSGKVLKHSLFHGHEGWTVLFNTGDKNGYSDAFAGSGESAATLLVHKVLQVPNDSLVLLDEPETPLPD